MKIKTIVERVRFKINDVDAYRFADEQIVNIINEAQRFVRNIFLELRTELLANKVETGTFAKGENVVQLEYIPVRYVDVRCGKKILHAVSIHEIADLTAVGEPEVYVVASKSAIAVYPLPDKEMPYFVTTVNGFTEQGLEDDSFFGDDYDDSLIEFTAMRLSMLDEFDESVEAQLLAEIRSNVQSKLLRLTSGPHFIKSYY